MAREIRQPGSIHLRIVEVMKRFPKGISATQIRHELQREGIPSPNLHCLIDRIAELEKWFIIERITMTPRAEHRRQVIGDEAQITEALRAAILYGARGHCQNCRKTIETDGITLVVQRKTPVYHGGVYYQEDLWAVCENCSSVKKAHRPCPIIVGARPKCRCCRVSTVETDTQEGR